MTESRNPSSSAESLTHHEAVRIALNDPEARAITDRIPLVARRRQLYAESAKGVLADLAVAGFPGLEEVGDLHRRRFDYRIAVPILLKWLPDCRYLLLAEDIVRTLSEKFARQQAMPVFVELFRDPPGVFDPLRPATSKPPQEHLREVIGIGIGVLASPKFADELIDLARDRKYGEARALIVRDLPKVRDDRVADVLTELLDDPSVLPFAVEGLGKMKDVGLRERIWELREHPDQNVRLQVKKALRKIPQP